jgi:hypothetical protein
MRHKTLFLLSFLAACSPQTDECGPSQDLKQWSAQGIANISSCGNSADVNLDPGAVFSLVRGYQADPASPVTLSANFLISSGAGKVTLTIWESTGPNKYMASGGSGPMSIELTSQPDAPLSGAYQLTIQGQAADSSPMIWSVSDVNVSP